MAEKEGRAEGVPAESFVWVDSEVLSALEVFAARGDCVFFHVESERGAEVFGEPRAGGAAGRPEERRWG